MKPNKEINNNIGLKSIFCGSQKAFLILRLVSAAASNMNNSKSGSSNPSVGT